MNMDAKKRKKILEKQNRGAKQGSKKRRKTAKDHMLKLNRFYSNGNFGIWIQCTNCGKWRNVMEYEEEHEVPERWTCSMSLSGTRCCDDPENIDDATFSPVDFVPGTIVWAKYNGYPWWPGMIEVDPDVEEYYWKDKHGKLSYNVTFLDDKVTRAWVPASSVCSFLNRPKQKYLPASYAKYSALLGAAEIKAENAMNLTIQERLKYFSFAHHFKGKWGSPLASDNESVCSLELKKNETDDEISLKTDSEHEKNGKKRACFGKERKLTSEEENVAHLKIQDDKTNEIGNESGHEISLKNDLQCAKNVKQKKKLKTEVCSSKERKLSKKEDHSAPPKIENDEVNKAETDKDEKTFILPKGKKGKDTPTKPTKNQHESRKNDQADKIKKISKIKNEKASKLENLEVKVDKAEEDTSSSIKKALYSKNAKTLNENKNHTEKTLNHCPNSKFKPPIKSNENNACEDNQSSKSMKQIKIASDNNLFKPGSTITEEKLVNKEISESKMERNEQRDKISITEKKIKSSKNSVEEKTKNEIELKENIVKILENNLKGSFESALMGETNATTSNETTLPATIKAENSQENIRKGSKKKHLKENLANSENQGSKKYPRKNKSTTSNMQQTKNIKNVMKVDLLKEDASVSSTGKSNLTDTFKVPRQNITKKEKIVVRNLKTDKVKETEEIIEKQGNVIQYASNKDLKEDVSCDVSKKEIFSLTVEMNLQETDGEDSDPFEAE